MMLLFDIVHPFIKIRPMYSFNNFFPNCVRFCSNNRNTMQWGNG